ncbi:MAG: 1-deoxy-D-xylulose-5-phosphate synthase [Spirochaetes bacterium]|nr:1-deoxy-D-xylulose-5-phosphate synthase [Spirochaetota bacterium]
MLDSINNVSDIRGLSVPELDDLAKEIRDYIIEVVSKNGGHIAPSLGVVELTLALHYVFNTPEDKIIWDVGHQVYAHKIITGRREAFKKMRTLGGISGFPKRDESVFDVYNTGHSSTSLSLALGEATGRDIRKEKYDVVAVIGDGSIGGGMAFEALNQIGHMKSNVIIILNDNEHFISRNVGALSSYLMKMITASFYNRLRKRSYEMIKRIPRYGNSIYDALYKFEGSLKGVFIPGILFEELGIRYFGPINGHDIGHMIKILSRIKSINSGPRILHVLTKKGKGYAPAEKDPALFHGIGPFDIKSGLPKKKNGMSFSEVAGRTLAEISKNDRRIIAITAAMKLGTGLNEFEKKSPDRLFDVGMAEQHAITFAGALASKGLRPFISIYSSFLQRAVDQLIHDVGIMSLPVRILIDRAGVVGDDGETHHGLFDISIIKNIPNFIFLAPSNGTELRDMIYFASHYDRGPVAIRYPRGSAGDDALDFSVHNSFEPGRAIILSEGKDIAILALGDMLDTAKKLQVKLYAENIESTVVNLQSIKPLDIRCIEYAIEGSEFFITLENGVISGGVGEYILSNIKRTLKDRLLFPAGFPDQFVTHGKADELFKRYGIDADSLFIKITDSIAALHRSSRYTALNK